MMRASWQYKQSPAGRQAHAQAGNVERLPQSQQNSSSLCGAQLSELLTPSRGAGEQRQAENWLYGTQSGNAKSSGLLPGVPQFNMPGVAAEAVNSQRKKARKND